MTAHRAIGADPFSRRARGSEKSSRRRSGELPGLVLDVLRLAGAPLTPVEVKRHLAARE